MRYGCTVAVAAVFIAGWGLTSSAEAACNPRNPTACTSDSQPAAATAPQPKAAAPLQLKRFIKLGPARRSMSGRGHHYHHRIARRSRHHEEAAKPIREADAKTAPAASPPVDPGTPVTPKAVPTVSIPARALAVAPQAADLTVGFAAPTEPWTGESAFAASDASETQPAGMTVARWDEVNAIDLAADAKPAGHAAASDSGVSLITPANASAASAVTTGAASREKSWTTWLYEKLFDGALAAVLAIRSMFA